VLRDLATTARRRSASTRRCSSTRCKAFGETYMPGTVAKLQLYKGERPIFDLFGIEEEIAARWRGAWT
jgi:ribonuclease G